MLVVGTEQLTCGVGCHQSAVEASQLWCWCRFASLITLPCWLSSQR
jgi:hypothetical protein